MIKPTFKEFKKLAKKGNVIPVYKDILADLETPVSAFLKIDSGRYSYLLESVESQENVGRYSFLAAGPSLVFSSKGRKVTLERFSSKGRTSRTYQCEGSPLDEVRKITADFRFVGAKGLPRFCGGLVGYMGYDTVRFFEKIPDKNPDELGIPDCVFMLSQNLVIFDHVNRTIKVLANAILESSGEKELKTAYDAAVGSIEAILRKLRTPLKKEKLLEEKRSNVAAVSNMTKKDFMNAVLRAKEYIRRGDIIQVVPSQRLKMSLKSKPIDIYRSLRSVNPSPYMFYLKLSGFTLVGSSPELLVRCQDGIVETRPIAGTRPRGANDAEDEALVRDLLSDAKEKAEHLMLVDLGRNDLGRVCRYGSVRVSEFMGIEKYSHVMHIVSNVIGRLKPGKDAFDALIACFPAGTVSGAPKIRAMEIIDELENTRRGPYAGAIGYFSFSGNLDSCIIIRTIFIKGDTLYIQAGAGIVNDSVPEREYYETLNKAKALLEAVKST
ncbi:MAG TPA: anthranilate synthase component I [Candidatus Omnitrophica bacterium]|nr:anthranilate synthase component I [Candidatus Omnitrophota bacterium]